MDDLFGSDSEHHEMRQSRAPRDAEEKASGIKRVKDDGLEDLFEDKMEDDKGGSSDEPGEASAATTTMTHKFERVRQNHDDLFGSDEEEEENLGGGGGGSDNERSAGGDYEDNGYPPYTQGEEEQRQYWMNAELTQDKRPYPVDGEYILVRWPNSLTLEARRFDPAKYIDLLAEDHDPAKFKSRGNKVPLDRIHQAYDSIRSAVLWRSVGNNSEKVPAMESNSRLVKWSDGSMTLLTGGGAHYDIKAETLSTPTAAGEDRHQQSAMAGRRYYYCVANHPSEGLMQTHFQFTQQWVLRPIAVESRPNSEIDKALGSQQPQQRGINSGSAFRAKPIVKGPKPGFGSMRFGVGGIFAGGVYKPYPEEAGDSAGTSGPAKRGGTKLYLGIENPEMLAKKAEQEELELEKEWKRREKLRLRQQIREESRGTARGSRGGDEDLGEEYYEDELEEDDNLGGGKREDYYARIRRERADRERGGAYHHYRSANVTASARRRDDYYDEEDNFVVSDNEELEVGSPDTFDEEEQEASDDGAKEGGVSKRRRLRISDDEEEG